jgi:nucleoside-diphosphate-sugar epimerase
VELERADAENGMRVLVTGAQGKVGRAAVTALLEAGHEVTALDVGKPVYERGVPGGPHYVQADLTDAGAAYATVRGHDAVVHAAAIPEPTHHAPHVVFSNNLMGMFNVLEAAVRWGVSRFVNISSETVPGLVFAERPFLPEYVPLDEGIRPRPQDPYALAKLFGEQLCDAAVQRSDVRCTSLRPGWVQWEGNVERNLGPLFTTDEPSAAFWAYTDVYDLADAIVLAVQSDLPGHEVMYITAPDTVGGRDLAEHVRRHHGDAIPVRPLSRPDEAGTSSAKAQRLLGYAPKRTWRDYLGEDGRLLPAVRERLERGETAMQRWSY